MPQSLNDIKVKITSTQNMSKITKAMQMISAAKLTKSESKLNAHKNYVTSLETIIKKTLETEVTQQHLFFNHNSDESITAYLVVTSDRGLAGGYNNKVLKMLADELKNRADDNYQIYLIGKKAFDYAKRSQLTVANEYLFVPDEMIYADLIPIINQLVADYASGKVTEIVVLYHDYISKLVQEPAMKQVLPLKTEILALATESSYIFNPNEADLADAILFKYLTSNIYGTVLTAKLAEHASRMNAMQNATDNADEIIKESQLIYNRARQAAITQEINEIVGGATALKKKNK